MGSIAKQKKYTEVDLPISVFQKGGIWQAEFPKERTVLCGGYEESNRHSLAQKLWTGLQRAQRQESLPPAFVELQAQPFEALEKNLAWFALDGSSDESHERE